MFKFYHGKHDTSTAYTHNKDFDDLISDERLYNFTTTEDDQSKPVVLMLSDGVVYFVLHQSASNPVKRRMALLSHDLARIILSYDTFGSHLDEQLKTADNELEKRNFKENTIINGYPVLVEYVDPEEHYQLRLDKKYTAWIEKHTMTCRYITQVVKCNNTSCYRPFRSGILQLLPNQFFPLQFWFSKILLLTNLLMSTSALSVINTSGFQNTNHLVCPIVVVYNYQYDKFLVSNDKEDTIPENAPESLFQEIKHIRTNQDHQAYLIDWETWKP
ncbi:25797_t:CDS:2, partial [Gigaspora margarita]